MRNREEGLGYGIAAVASIAGCRTTHLGSDTGAAYRQSFAAQRAGGTAVTIGA